MRIIAAWVNVSPLLGMCIIAAVTVFSLPGMRIIAAWVNVSPLLGMCIIAAWVGNVPRLGMRIIAAHIKRVAMDRISAHVLISAHPAVGSEIEGLLHNFTSPSSGF